MKYVLSCLHAVVALCSGLDPSRDEYFIGSASFDRKAMTLNDRGRIDCYSCMSRSYLKEWHTLMINFYPPINFTDACDDPRSGPGGPLGNRMGTVDCAGPCVTVVERFRLNGPGLVIGTRYMRGCANRLLLFGMDEPLRSEIAAVGPEEFCRVTKKQHIPLPGSNRRAGPKGQVANQEVIDSVEDFIVLCSCISDRCNKAQMFNRAPDNGVARNSVVAVILLLLAAISQHAFVS